MRINADNLDSSMIARMVWEGDTMDVVFNSGVLYRYEGVPSRVFMAIAGAESIGQSFNALVKKGSYPYRRIALRP